MNKKSKKFIEQKKETVYNLIKQEKYTETINICQQMFELQEVGDSDKELYLFSIAYCYYFSDSFENAKEYYIKVLSLNPNDEDASMGMYLSLIALKQYKEAIAEMQRFLETNPADAYKDTLEELMGDLLEGTATAYKATILSLAKKNNVPIPAQLSMTFFEDYPPPPCSFGFENQK